MSSLDNAPVFLKLGGSLITDKFTPGTARPAVLARLAGEIAGALQHDPGLRLVLGHGSGSFGHFPARKYGTRQGVRTPEEWHGFAEVWHQATALTRLVIEALHKAGLPAVAFSPSAGVTARQGRVETWNLQPLKQALQYGLVPVVHGDVVFDEALGGTILSTEDLFSHLGSALRPARILIAGLEEGVWADYPACTKLVGRITPASFEGMHAALHGAEAADVTGGMAGKVREMLGLASRLPGTEIRIFGGTQPGTVKQALLGKIYGTAISAE